MKKFKIYYGEMEKDYIHRELEKQDVLNGYLSEAKAFDLFFDDMIMCNNYFKNNDFMKIDYLIDAYNEEEDYYVDEYQYFIINPAFDEDVTIKAVEKMGNTLYYDNEKELYIMGVTDLGTSRRIVPTDIKVEEV